MWAFIAENSEKTSIVWINLEKETANNLEYASDISNYIAANGNVIENKDDKFLQQSFNQLYAMYMQNPTAEPREPFNEIVAPKLSVRYNYSTAVNSTRLAMQYNSSECSHYANLSIKEHEIYSSAEAFIENITACITSMISGRNSNYIFVGTDHGLSVLTFKAAKKLSPDAKIGVVVFDEHVDIYGTKNENNLIGKENVFGKLLIEEYADYIVFLQASETAKDWTQYSVDQNFTRYDIFKRMEIYSDNDLADGKWQQILANSLGNMKKSGVTNILISVDLDGLPTGYTGFEYSILAPAIAAIRFGNRSQPSFAEVEEGFSKGLEPFEIKSYISYIKYQAAIDGIKFGVSNGNTTILGDIQELLPKQDLNNETARAASQIIKSLAR